MTSDLAHDVRPVAQPCELATRRGGEDCGLAILALVSVLRYIFAIVSVTS